MLREEEYDSMRASYATIAEAIEEASALSVTTESPEERELTFMALQILSAQNIALELRRIGDKLHMVEVMNLGWNVNRDGIEVSK